MEYTQYGSYVRLLKEGLLEERTKLAQNHLINCNLCPHKCGVNRREQIGFCRAKDKVVISSYGPHFGEEPPLVGRNGSGTIFFAYCNMKCVFCQNCELSFGGEGKVITTEELSQVMLKLQNQYKCHNINLVTPTHFVPNILEALLMAAQKGLVLPIVYNCGGYEELVTLKLLEGIISIYMPDFKYHLEERGQIYSKVMGYPLKVQEALKEMDQQVGGLKINNKGIAYQGLLIRHLMMPGGIEDTKAILNFVKEELSPDCQVNLMDQYYPEHKAYQYEEISRRLSNAEYTEALNYAKALGIKLI